jgi:hypothetical protein
MNTCNRTCRSALYTDQLQKHCVSLLYQCKPALLMRNSYSICSVLIMHVSMVVEMCLAYMTARMEEQREVGDHAEQCECQQLMLTLCLG